MKNQPDKSAGKTSSEPLLTLNLLRGRRRGSKKLREIVQKGNKIYTYIYTSCIDINSRICALHYAQFLHFCRVEGRRIKFNKAFIARTWKKATMDKVCEALYNIEINNAFELVTLLLIVHVWPSSFQESNRLVLSLSYFFHFSLSILFFSSPAGKMISSLPPLPTNLFLALYRPSDPCNSPWEDPTRLQGCWYRVLATNSLFLTSSFHFLLVEEVYIDPSIFLID